MKQCGATQADKYVSREKKEWKDNMGERDTAVQG